MPIQVNNVFHAYLKKTPQVVGALKGVSLNIVDKSFVALIGETGSGKSTLAQHLNALLIPDEGTIQVDDFLITNNKRKNKKLKPLRKHVGLVFQFSEYQLFEETVERDVAFGPRNFGATEEEALKVSHESLLKVGLDESYFKRSPFELSGGEKRKVALAGILALNPDILILDEPTVGLDYSAAKEIMRLVNAMHNDGKTIILITHDMDLVIRYCDKAFYLEEGKLIFEGKPSDLFFSQKVGLSYPPLYELAVGLINKGYKIPLDQIHTVRDLLPYIKEHHNG